MSIVPQRKESMSLIPGLALYQTRSATPDSGAFSDTVLSQLKELRGLTGWRFGVSTRGVDHVATIDLAIRHTDLFSCVQTTFNPLAQASGETLERAQAAVLEVLVK